MAGSASKPGDYILVAGVPPGYTWQSWKDLNRQLLGGRDPGWADVCRIEQIHVPGHDVSQTSGWGAQVRGFKTHEDAEHLYMKLAEKRCIDGYRLLIHHFDTSASPPTLLKHTCTDYCPVQASFPSGCSLPLSPDQPSCQPHSQPLSPISSPPYTAASPSLPMGYPVAAPTPLISYSPIQAMEAPAQTHHHGFHPSVKSPEYLVTSLSAGGSRSPSSNGGASVSAAESTGAGGGGTGGGGGSSKVERRVIFISGIAVTTRPEQLLTLLRERELRPQQVDIQRDARGQSKGFAVAQFASGEDALRAVRGLHGLRHHPVVATNKKGRLEARLAKEATVAVPDPKAPCIVDGSNPLQGEMRT